MNEGDTVGIAISGDPKRPILAKALRDIYRTYEQIEYVVLRFDANPAQAFNRAVQWMLGADLFVGIGGDVYVGESELMKFLRHPAPIAYALSPLTPRRHERSPYPIPWSERTDWGFTSGLFKCPRSVLLEHPFQERWSFVEDVAWVREYGFETVGIQVPCAHIDVHPLFRKKTIRYFFTLPGFLPHTSLREDFSRLARMLAWEWQEPWNAIRGEKR